MSQIIFAIVVLCSLSLSLSFVIGHGKSPVSVRAFAKSSGMISERIFASDKAPKMPEKKGLDRFFELVEESKKIDPSKKKPPIYEPGSYPVHILSAMAYLIPIVDASDVGKYMFEAYPSIGDAYNTLFGPLAALYNGVPFLPFLIFFAMSYVCRAPNFPVEVRFHFSQAFMISIIQFLPSLLFGVMEKAGVPGMGILYNTLFIWVMASSIIMQGLLLNPLSSLKNPFLLNVVGWSMKYMNYSPDMVPK